MSKKILLAIMSLAVAAALVSVATYAWFTDTASSTGNRFNASTMDLQVDGAQVMAPMHFTDLAPGSVVATSYVVSNIGSTWGDVALSLGNFVDSDGTLAPAEGAIAGEPKADMGSSLNVKVMWGSATVYEGSLAGFVAGGPYTLGTLWPATNALLSIEASVPGTVGNELMGDYASFDATLSLTSRPDEPLDGDSGGLP